jgi:hypothetical protein
MPGGETQLPFVCGIIPITHNHIHHHQIAPPVFITYVTTLRYTLDVCNGSEIDHGL